MEIEEYILLAPYTTFHIGGPARYFARVANTRELAQSLAYARGLHLPVFFLGGGSNVLADDAGYPGLVLKIEIMGVEEEGDVLVAGAGESWDALVARAGMLGLWGIENLSGIPGTAGGACVQNIGAYGRALSQTFLWADVYDSISGAERRIDKGAYHSGYRDSIFKRESNLTVLRVALALSRKPQADVSYKDLALRFAGTAPSLQDIRNAVLEIRAGKFPDLSAEGSAGSFFKNPIVSPEEADQLQQKYPGLPVFKLPESKGVKIPLGWLLDWRHGVIDLRGKKFGQARMYEKQFLVMTAARGASSEDLKMLAQFVAGEIKRVCNIAIEPEVKVL